MRVDILCKRNEVLNGYRYTIKKALGLQNSAAYLNYKLDYDNEPHQIEML
jgi:hypothetical protein